MKSEVGKVQNNGVQPDRVAIGHKAHEYTIKHFRGEKDNKILTTFLGTLLLIYKYY